MTQRTDMLAWTSWDELTGNDITELQEDDCARENGVEGNGGSER